MGDAQAKACLLRKRVDKVGLILEKLKALDDPQSQLLLLRSCFSLPKINFALRTLHFSEIGHVIQDFDCLVDNAFSNILGFSVSHIQRVQAALPIGEGFPGFGLPKAEPTSHCAYLASCVQSLGIQEALLSVDSPLDLPDLAVSSMAHINSFLDPSSRVSLPTLQVFKKPQHELVSRLAKVAFASLLDFSRNQSSDLARMLSCSMKHSGSFLQVLPNNVLNSYLPKREFQVLCRLRLGAPVFHSPAPCVRCGKTADIYGIHSSQCAVGGYVIRRHDALRDELARICADAGCSVIVEQRGLFELSNERPGDLRIKNSQNNLDLLIDVSVVSPVANYTLSKSSKTMAAAATSMETTKLDKYYERLSLLGTNFSPFVFESFGGWTSFGDSIISQIAGVQSFNTNMPVSDCVARINNRLSIVLAKKMAEMILCNFSNRDF